MSASPIDWPRRRVLLAGLALCLAPRRGQATQAEMQAAMAAFTGGRAIETGRIRLDVPALVENGNAVPLTVAVDSPMTVTDHVRRIGLFNEKNPQPQIAVFHLSPHAGRAQVSTRIRLGDTQFITALAETSDGAFWQARVEVVVTLPACVEE